MKKSASATWSGGLKDGQGTISTQTGVLREAPFGFKSRFEDGPGTNPEELIAAAHAGCFAMAFSAQLGGAGLKPERVDAKATVTLEKVESGFAVTSSHLEVVVKLSTPDQAKFEQAANAAKTGCPISKLLNAKITLDAKLA